MKTEVNDPLHFFSEHVCQQPIDAERCVLQRLQQLPQNPGRRRRHHFRLLSEPKRSHQQAEGAHLQPRPGQPVPEGAWLSEEPRFP